MSYFCENQLPSLFQNNRFMNTSFRFVCAIAMIACFSLSANAQRQQALYIDNGSGGFTTITATGGPGTLNLPSSGSLLSSGAGQVINGLLTLGVDGVGGVAGELDILDGGSNEAALAYQSGNLNIYFPFVTSSPAGLNITGQASSAGSGGSVSITGGDGISSGISGGGVSLTGGFGISDPGGEVSVTGGGSTGGNGGEAIVIGGNSGATGGNGGAAIVEGGSGNGTPSSQGGLALIVGGNGGTTGNTGGSGGQLSLQGGSGGSGSGSNGNGGSISIDGGSAGSGAGTPGSTGSVFIQSTAGNTFIGNSTSQVSISTTNWGVTGSGSVTATTYFGDGSHLTGISSGFTPAYFNAYATSIPFTIPAGGEIPLPPTGATISGFTPDGTGGYIVAATGIYNVEYTVARDEPSAFAISVNGAVAANSVFGCATGTTVVHGSAILSLTTGNDITLVASPNNSTAVTLESVVTGTVEASLTAIRIQ
jgi:hypothetical protein